MWGTAASMGPVLACALALAHLVRSSFARVRMRMEPHGGVKAPGLFHKSVGDVAIAVMAVCVQRQASCIIRILQRREGSKQQQRRETDASPLIMAEKGLFSCEEGASFLSKEIKEEL